MDRDLTFIGGILMLGAIMVFMAGLYAAGVDARQDVCRELLHDRRARYVGMPEVCTAPQAGVTRADD